MRPSITWLITDTHFFHDLMVEECGRPVDCEKIIMRNLKHMIASQDLLIHLGDVIFYKYPLLKGMLDSVPCRKILTMGNHDHKSKGWYMRAGFDWAVDTFTLGNTIFSHRPMEILPSGVEFNVHGHMHTNMHRKGEGWYDPKVHRLLSLENADYKPVKLCMFLPKAAV